METYHVRVYPIEGAFFLPPEPEELVVGLVAAKRHARALVQTRQGFPNCDRYYSARIETHTPVCVVEVTLPTYDRIYQRYWWTAWEHRTPAGATIQVVGVRPFRGSISRNMKPPEMS